MPLCGEREYAGKRIEVKPGWCDPLSIRSAAVARALCRPAAGQEAP